MAVAERKAQAAAAAEEEGSADAGTDSSDALVGQPARAEDRPQAGRRRQQSRRATAAAPAIQCSGLAQAARASPQLELVDMLRDSMR